MKDPFTNHTFSSLPGFSLIETMLWEKGGYFLLPAHMERLEKSARYFSFSCGQTDIEKALKTRAASFEASKKYRIRLLLKKSGEFSAESSELTFSAPQEPLKSDISNQHTDRADIFLYHKTTNRSLYDQELDRCRAAGFFDVIFTNKEKEVTEGAITNIVIRKGAHYLTPPVSCGLLPGVYREYLLKSGELPLEEKVLHVEDLMAADEIFLVNSLRKMVPVTLPSTLS